MPQDIGRADLSNMVADASRSVVLILDAMGWDIEVREVRYGV